MKYHRSLLGFVRTLALAAALGFAGSAHATTFAPLTVEQFTDASTWIVRGQVKELWTTLEDDGTVWTHARLNVTDVLKGERRTSSLVVSSLGGVNGENYTFMPGAAQFSVDEDVFLFLHRQGNGRLVPVSWSHGKYTIRRAPGERAFYARHFETQSAEERFDHRFLPHPPPEQRLYLNDLEDRVRGRLRTGWDGLDIPGMRRQQLEEANLPARRSP
jgi:hypothetical protein